MSRRRLSLWTLTLALALATAPVPAPGAEAPTRVLTLRYDRPGVVCASVVIGVHCWIGVRPNPHIQEDEHRVRVSVTDDLGFRVHAYVYDTDPEDTDGVDTCGPDGVADTAVVPGSNLWVDVYLYPTRACGDSPSSVATSGTVTIEFYAS